MEIRRDGLRRQLQPIGAADLHRAVRHPHQRRLELVGDLRRRVGGGQNIAARAIDLIGQRQRHGLAGDGFVKVAIERNDAAYLVVLPEGNIRTASPARTLPAAIRPAKPRKSRFGRLTIATGIRNGLAASASGVDLDGFEMLDQRRPRIPRHRRRSHGDIVALEPEIGIAVKPAMPIDVAKSAYSVTIAS